MRFSVSSDSSKGEHKPSPSAPIKELFDAIQSFNFKMSLDSAIQLKKSIQLTSLSLIDEKEVIGPLLSSALLQALEKASEAGDDSYCIVPSVISKLLLFCKETRSVKLGINKFPHVHSMFTSLLLFSASVLDQMDIVLLLYKTHDKNKPYDLLPFASKVDNALLECLNDRLLKINSPLFYQACNEFLYFFNKNFQTKVVVFYLFDFSIPSLSVSKDKLIAAVFSSTFFIHKSELSLLDHMAYSMTEIKGHFNFTTPNLFQFQLSLTNGDVVSFSLIDEADAERLNIFLGNELDSNIQKSISIEPMQSDKNMIEEHCEINKEPLVLLPSKIPQDINQPSTMDTSFSLIPTSMLANLNETNSTSPGTKLKNITHTSKLATINPHNSTEFSQGLLRNQHQVHKRQSHHLQERQFMPVKGQLHPMIDKTSDAKLQNLTPLHSHDDKLMSGAITSVSMPITPPPTIHKKVTATEALPSDVLHTFQQNVKSTLVSSKSIRAFFFLTIRKNQTTDISVKCQSSGIII